MVVAQRIQFGPKVHLSSLAYGMWRLADDPDTSERHVQKKIETCLEQGITTLDQADIYGGYEAEEVLGNCLSQSPGLKDQVEIVTKCGILIAAGRYSDVRVKHYNTSKEHIIASVEHSLRLMNIEVIDLLLIHRPDPFMDPREAAEGLETVLASGKVKSVGVSNFKSHDWDLLQSAMSTPLVTNQIELSVQAVDAFTNGDLAHLQAKGLPVMAWSPLGGGSLFDGSAAALVDTLEKVGARYSASVSSTALAWLMAHPAKIVPVLGTNRVDRIREASEALSIVMDRQDWFEIYTAACGCEVS